MRFITFILLSVFLFSCYQDAKPKRPENLIPRDEMAEILYDVYILNSAKGINKKLLEVNGVFPEEYVFDKYKIDSVQFAQSNNYYAYNIKDYEVIMDSVKNRINRNLKIFEDIKNTEEVGKKRVRDSLNEIYKREKDSGMVTPRRNPKKLFDSISKIQN